MSKLLFAKPPARPIPNTPKASMLSAPTANAPPASKRMAQVLAGNVVLPGDAVVDEHEREHVHHVEDQHAAHRAREAALRLRIGRCQRRDRRRREQHRHEQQLRHLPSTRYRKRPSSTSASQHRNGFFTAFVGSEIFVSDRARASSYIALKSGGN